MRVFPSPAKANKGIAEEQGIISQRSFKNFIFAFLPVKIKIMKTEKMSGYFANTPGASIDMCL